MQIYFCCSESVGEFSEVFVRLFFPFLSLSDKGCRYMTKPVLTSGPSRPFKRGKHALFIKHVFDETY